MPEALRLALSVLTIVPVRGPSEPDRRTAGRAMELAPLVGILLGLVAGLITVAVRRLGGTDLLGAALAVGGLAVTTRGLHLDGLTDLADGLASYRDPAATRAVMKGPGVGALGVATLVLTLLVQVAALEQVLSLPRCFFLVVLVVALGRVSITSACRLQPATDEGLGALVAGTVRPWVTTGWIIALAAVAGGLQDDWGRAARVVIAVVIALVAARLLRDHAVRRVGGITGDVLGALVETTTAVALVVLALS